MRGRDGELRHLKECYVLGWISVEELEAHVAEVLRPEWSPTRHLNAVLKEMWLR